MKHESRAEIEAPRATVWAVFSDVAHWPDWTASVQHATPLDGPELVVGARFAIKQPRMSKLVWEVTAVDPGRSWIWENRSLGTTTVGWHELTELDGGRTLARQGIEQRGLLAPLLGALMSRMTERYLALEAAGLKALSEARHAEVRARSEQRPSS